MLAPASDDTDVEVRRVDQDMINEFGRLNTRKSDVREELELEEKRKQELEDAEESVMLADSDAGTIKVLIGEAFIDVDTEYAQAFIEKKSEANAAALAALHAELTAIAARQGELKKVLYARFGKSINLEE